MEPGLIVLIALACPIGMGLMMWLMAKWMRGERREEQAGEQPRELSLTELRDQRSRLKEQIERLEEGKGDREPAKVARDR